MDSQPLTHHLPDSRLPVMPDSPPPVGVGSLVIPTEMARGEQAGGKVSAREDILSTVLLSPIVDNLLPVPGDSVMYVLES